MRAAHPTLSCQRSQFFPATNCHYHPHQDEVYCCRHHRFSRCCVLFRAQHHLHPSKSFSLDVHSYACCVPYGPVALHDNILLITLFQQPNTALQGHALAGYRPGKDAPSPVPAPAPAGGVPGFSGFGHATGAAPAAAPAASTGVPGFSGFGHAAGASTPAAAPAAPPAPVFSGFGHATGPMGGNPSITAKK